MLVNVNGNIRQWSLVDSNGIDYVQDFVGNVDGWEQVIPVSQLTGKGLEDYENRDEQYDFVTDEDNANYWERCISIQQDIDKITHQLEEQLDYEEISKALRDTDDSDFDVQLSNIRTALTELAEEKGIALD